LVVLTTCHQKKWNSLWIPHVPLVWWLAYP
jgi:hypothetical protein